MTREEIFEKIKEAIVCVAHIKDKEMIKMESRLITDLGLDSLDMLDLIFHLEKIFKIKLDPKEIAKRSREKLGDRPFEKEGILTEDALIELRKAMPEVPQEELHSELLTKDLGKVFRVITFVRIIEGIQIYKSQHKDEE